MVNNNALKLDRTFSALGDATRRSMLAQLAYGPAPVKKLAEPFPISAPAISKHLRVLEAAGLISREKRGREHWCRLEERNMAEAAKWIETQRAVWNDLLDSLESYLQRTDPGSGSANASRTPKKEE